MLDKVGPAVRRRRAYHFAHVASDRGVPENPAALRARTLFGRGTPARPLVKLLTKGWARRAQVAGGSTRSTVGTRSIDLSNDAIRLTPVDSAHATRYDSAKSNLSTS